MKKYSYKAVETFISEKLAPAGYDIHQIPGSLVDEYVCIAPSENYYNFIFREQYINEWSSGLSMHRYKNLPAFARAMLNREEQEVAS